MFMNFDFISDEEEEVLEMVPRPREPRLFRERVDFFNMWRDKEFFKRFRLTKETVLQILETIRPDIELTMRNHTVSPLNSLLLTLRFFATGSFLMTAGDFSGVSEATAFRCIWRVAEALIRIRNQHIFMPSTPEEIAEIQMKFYNMASFPRVLGVIDGTHVKIQSTGGAEAEIFRNRKGYFSKNVQVLAGPDLEILDISTGWPGSAHDLTVFNASRLNHRLEAGEWGDKVILGDSGYECRPHILVPVPNAVTEGEIKYNESLIRTRQLVERTFGVWKRRFPILAIGIRCSLRTMFKFNYYIVACAILHNIAVRNKEPVPVVDNEVAVPVYNMLNDIHIDPLDVNAPHRLAVREALIQNYFALLANNNDDDADADSDH